MNLSYITYHKTTSFFFWKKIKTSINLEEEGDVLKPTFVLLDSGCLVEKLCLFLK